MTATNAEHFPSTRILHPQENPAKKLPSFDHASRLSFCVSRRSESEKNKKITEWDPQEAEEERQARQGKHAVISPRRSDLRLLLVMARI
jgi:hypothetical protein